MQGLNSSPFIFQIWKICLLSIVSVITIVSALGD